MPPKKNIDINYRMMYGIKGISYTKNVWLKLISKMTEGNMARKVFFIGTLITVLLFGCETGTNGGDGSKYPYAEYFPEKVISVNLSERPHIYIYFNKKIVDSYIWRNDTAFSVTVGGVPQSLVKDIELTPPSYDRVGIWFSNDLPSSGDIKVSYDGTGVLAGKLEPFSDMTVSRK
jgi:hypothetical protein